MKVKLGIKQGLSYEVLDDYIRQSPLFLELRNEQQKRIVIGGEGGLLYKIFEDEKHASKNINISSRGDAFLVTRYLEAVDTYLKSVEEHARRFFFFDLLAVYESSSEPKIRIRYWDTFSSPFAAAGIGDWRIESLKEAERFLMMIKESPEHLNQLYHEVKLQSGNF